MKPCFLWNKKRKKEISIAAFWYLINTYATNIYEKSVDKTRNGNREVKVLTILFDTNHFLIVGQRFGSYQNFYFFSTSVPTYHWHSLSHQYIRSLWL